jgi:hypothetical protein
MKKCYAEEKRHIGGDQTLCPYLTREEELCLAALASSMIDKKACSGARYKDCAIFFVNMQKSGETQKCSNPGNGQAG